MDNLTIITQDGKENALDYISENSITIVGFLAIHPSITFGGVNNQRWSITHIPSGMVIFNPFYRKESAIKIARIVVKDIPELEEITCQGNLTYDIWKKYKAIKKNIQVIIQE